MSNLSNWAEVRAKFEQAAIEHPDVSADWDVRQDQWTFSRLQVDDCDEPVSADCVRQFKATARDAIRLLGKLNEPLPPFVVWLNFLRHERRGFRRMFQVRNSRDFAAFAGSGGSIDTSSFPGEPRDDGNIPRVFKESADFCEDLAYRAAEVNPEATAVNGTDAVLAKAVEPKPPEKRKRGRPQKIPDERKKAAADLKASGASNDEAAAAIYNVRYPTSQQKKNVSAILKHYERRLNRLASSHKPRKGHSGTQ
jgi:hypothetical protein